MNGLEMHRRHVLVGIGGAVAVGAAGAGLSILEATTEEIDQAVEMMSHDQEAIANLLRQQQKAFVERSAELMRGLYVDDADWTNAFGRTLKGEDNIIAYLKELFADENFTAGKVVGEPEVAIRTVGRDTVAAKIHTKIEGQRTVDGGTLPMRQNHSLKLIARQPDGSWKIVSEIYMDARQEVTHIHTE